MTLVEEQSLNHSHINMKLLHPVVVKYLKVDYTSGNNNYVTLSRLKDLELNQAKMKEIKLLILQQQTEILRRHDG